MKRILCVDDDANILAAIQRQFRKKYQIDIALGPRQGLKAVSSGEPYAVVVADMNMPEMNGVEFLIQFRRQSPDTVRIMLTGNADQQTAMQAVNQGHVFQFLNKPCPPENLAAALEAGLRQYQLVSAERELLEKTLSGSVKMLTDMLSMLDPNSFGRAQRLRDLVRAFGQSRNLTPLWELEMAAMLSPVGYLTVPATVLEKAPAAQNLSAPEQHILARVPEIGARLVANIPRLESVAQIILYHHKNFDGSGFPTDKVAGQDIPIGARILRVLQDVLLLESQKLPRTKVLETMRACPGRYDPQVLEAVAASFDVYIPPVAAGDIAHRAVALNELCAGQILTSPLMARDGTVIAPAGTEVSSLLLQKLQNIHQLTGLTEPIQGAVGQPSSLS